MQFCRNRGITSFSKSTFPGVPADKLPVKADSPRPAHTNADLRILSLELLKDARLKLKPGDGWFIGFGLLIDRIIRQNSQSGNAKLEWKLFVPGMSKHP